MSKFINFDTSNVTRADWDANGFYSRSDNTIAFTDATRTFSIQPTSTDFKYLMAGVSYTSTGDTVVITDVEGLHVIYYDGSTLTSYANPTNGLIDSLIRTKALVAMLYWSVSASEAIYFGEERHGKTMSSASHNYHHWKDGLAYIRGLSLTDIVIGDGSSDTHVQYGVDEGLVSDEDLPTRISTVTSTTGLPVYYMTGSGYWNKSEVANFSVMNASGGRILYNQFTGGSWQTTEITNADFVLYHLFATPNIDSPMIVLMGQNDYLTARSAKEGANNEIKSLITQGGLSPEIRAIGTIIYKSKDTYGNSVKAKIVQTDDGEDYVDWRDVEITRTSVATDSHGDLSGLTNDDHTQYVTLIDRGTDETLTIGDISTDKIIARSSEGLKLYEDGGNGIFIKDGGNIGIGTVIPATKLHIVDGTGEFIFDASNLSSGYSAQFVLDDIGFDIGNNSNRQLNLKTNSLDRLTILGTGNAGIGTTTPSYKLDVNGTLRAVGAVTLDSNLNVTGATYLSNTLTVTSRTTLNGELILNDAMTLNDTLEVTDNFVSAKGLHQTSVSKGTIAYNNNLDIGTLPDSNDYYEFIVDYETDDGAGNVKRTFQKYSYFVTSNTLTVMSTFGETPLGSVNFSVSSRVVNFDWAYTSGTAKCSDMQILVSYKGAFLS